MVKECFWKTIAENPQSTSQQDMAKRPEEVKCFICDGWEEECTQKIEKDSLGDGTYIFG